MAPETLHEPYVTIGWLLAKLNSPSDLPAFPRPFCTFEKSAFAIIYCMTFHKWVDSSFRKNLKINRNHLKNRNYCAIFSLYKLWPLKIYKFVFSPSKFWVRFGPSEIWKSRFHARDNSKAFFSNLFRYPIMWPKKRLQSADFKWLVL